MQAVRTILDISARRACRYLCANRRMGPVRGTPADDSALRKRLEELAAERVSSVFGDWRSSSKSEHEKNVREATKTSYDLHMENVFTVSPAKVLVMLGKVPKRRSWARTPSFQKRRKKINLGGKPRAVFFLPHPNEHGDKKSLAPITVTKHWRTRGVP